MLRLPLNRWCLENRAVDMSCNAYLCAALHLAAGLEGIENKADPGDPINLDVYQMSRRDLPNAGMTTLPPTRLHALEAFDEDSLVEEALGAEFKEIFLSQKMGEWNRGFFHVSDEQREQILTHI